MEDIMAEKMATREAYGRALAELGETYDFVVLDADLAAATKTELFRKKFPDRFFDCGIAEGNMMGVAAGLAAAGQIPFASSFAMFAAGRAFEQVRNSIGYPHLNVKIGATHAGITVGEDGASHQCNEDIALMRVIPGMTVICPADAAETRAAVEAALKYEGPVYMRFGRYAVPTVTDYTGRPFEIGKASCLRAGNDVTIAATGFMVHLALEAADQLAVEGISAEVINVPTIKPLDRETLTASARKTGAVVTAEEHSVIGGLGSAVAECLTETCPVPVLKVGVQDVFGTSGSVPALLEAYGLTSDEICRHAKEAIAARRA